MRDPDDPEGGGVGGRSDNLLSIRLKPKVSMRQWNEMTLWA